MNTRSLEERTYIYWKLSKGFHVADAPSISAEKAFNIIAEILATTDPKKHLTKYIKQLRQQLIMNSLPANRLDNVSNTIIETDSFQ